MRYVFVVVGELDDGRIDTFYGVTHSAKRADELCAEAEELDTTHNYTWYPVTEEDDE